MAPPSRPRTINYGVGDEISYAFGSGIVYGEVVRVLEAGAAIEILFEDGRKEIKKSRDGALHLVRRVSGKSETEELHSDRSRLRDQSVSEVIRSEKRRGSR
jgi:exosome complex RNA-binding protein Csl4